MITATVFYRGIVDQVIHNVISIEAIKERGRGLKITFTEHGDYVTKMVTEIIYLDDHTTVIIGYEEGGEK